MDFNEIMNAILIALAGFVLGVATNELVKANEIKRMQEIHIAEIRKTNDLWCKFIRQLLADCEEGEEQHEEDTI